MKKITILLISLIIISSCSKNRTTSIAENNVELETINIEEKIEEDALKKEEYVCLLEDNIRTRESPNGKIFMQYEYDNIPRYAQPKCYKPLDKKTVDDYTWYKIHCQLWLMEDVDAWVGTKPEWIQIVEYCDEDNKDKINTRLEYRENNEYYNLSSFYELISANEEQRKYTELLLKTIPALTIGYNINDYNFEKPDNNFMQYYIYKILSEIKGHNYDELKKLYSDQNDSMLLMIKKSSYNGYYLFEELDYYSDKYYGKKFSLSDYLKYAYFYDPKTSIFAFYGPDGLGSDIVYPYIKEIIQDDDYTKIIFSCAPLNEGIGPIYLYDENNKLIEIKGTSNILDFFVHKADTYEATYKKNGENLILFSITSIDK